MNRKENLIYFTPNDFFFCWWDKPIIAILGLAFLIFWVLNNIKNWEIENQQISVLICETKTTESRLWAPGLASVSLAGGHSLVERRHTPASGAIICTLIRHFAWDVLAGAFEHHNTSAQEMNSLFQKQSSPFLAPLSSSLFVFSSDWGGWTSQFNELYRDSWFDQCTSSCDILAMLTLAISLSNFHLSVSLNTEENRKATPKF